MFDDGESTAKVQTTSGSEEYLVTRAPKKTCSCFELQEMVWPCEHIMAWDDQEGQKQSEHFHKCWRTQSLLALYDQTIPSFVVTDLQLSPNCAPPEVAVKRGRHRMVRFQRGNRHGPRAIREGEDVVYNTSGELFLRYPVFDDPNRVEPFPTANTAAGLPRLENHKKTKRCRSTGKCTCSNCGQVGHNRRTCPKIAEVWVSPLPSRSLHSLIVLLSHSVGGEWSDFVNYNLIVQVDNAASRTSPNPRHSPQPSQQELVPTSQQELVATEYCIASTAPSSGIGLDNTIQARHDDPFQSYNAPHLPPEYVQRLLELAEEVAMDCQGFGSQYQEDITSFD